MKYASIFRRLAAYLIDCLLVFAVFVIALQFVLFTPIRNTLFNSEIWFQSGWNTEAYTLLTISLPIWLYFIFYESSHWQATVGKRLLKLLTIDKTIGGRISVKQAALRTLVKLIPWELAHLTNNLPTPMWYDPNPGFRAGFAIVPVLVTLYVCVAQFTSTRQGPHDLAACTLVMSKT